MLRTLTLILSLAASPAAAECFADYKARSDDPYRLAYGVEQELGPRLAAAGWTLLSVVSVFGPEGLAERQDRAADHFLAY
jgi:hypothetical protein